ncbi:MAG: hypothetical protein WD688_02060 [Candidatus Binatia bacterium]
MTIAYVVTSNGNDVFADMALVSMISARITNPAWRIVLICDKETVGAARTNKHRMLSMSDEVVEVDTPSGAPVFVNRWMKTQAIQWVSDACLLLDTDTLLRRPLDDLPNLVEHLGAVPNYNTDNASEQIWAEDLEELRRMDWPAEFAFYANGGALFFKQTALVKHFFALWHSFYMESVMSLSRNRDQPSLNSAITASSVPLARLPDGFNFQVRGLKTEGVQEAQIWHYYSSIGQADTSFNLLVGRAGGSDLRTLRNSIGMALARPSPLLTREESTAESKGLSAVEQMPVVGRVSQTAGDDENLLCFDRANGSKLPGRTALPGSSRIGRWLGSVVKRVRSAR